MNVYVLATLDTKGAEAAFLRDCLVAAGVAVQLVDTGSGGPPQVIPDVGRDVIFGTAEIPSDRGEAVAAAARGATQLVLRMYREGRLSGVLAIGGSAGTTIGTAAMRELPLGVPKVMLSTLASGDVRPFVGVRDIVMVNSVVDLAGLNRISRTVLAEAAHAMAGMVLARPPSHESEDRPVVAATMFGVTTPCVEHARHILEEAGFEVLVFHATGTGGRAMEGLIRDGLIAGVLDVTTTELADELVGGVLSAGPDRLTAAGEMGIPQVVSVGATDMVNFWSWDSVPSQFRDRKLYRHNDNVTLMRTTAEESRHLGAVLAAKVSQAQGPVAVMLPRRGVSAIDRTGQPFDDADARAELFAAVRDGLPADDVIEIDQHINDPEFARAAAEKLIQLMRT